MGSEKCRIFTVKKGNGALIVRTSRLEPSGYIHGMNDKESALLYRTCAA
ncbi:MAG: hypothetical protein IJZ45_01360 [Bacteroidaceae bacterium]|nr:hypothetical protein [Bacteroidaceae bacterium]